MGFLQLSNRFEEVALAYFVGRNLDDFAISPDVNRQTQSDVLAHYATDRATQCDERLLLQLASRSLVGGFAHSLENV